MSTESRREIDAAKAAAAAQRRRIEEQEPLIRAEAQAVRWLLQENNLAARVRRAFAGERDQ